jgi:hypothetical protein
MPGGLGGIGSIASLASSAGGGKGGGGGGGSGHFTPPVSPQAAAQQVGAQYADYGMYNSTPRLVDQFGAANMASLTNAQAQQSFDLQNQNLQNQAQLLGGEVAGNQATTGGTDVASNVLGNTGGSLSS